MKKFLIYFFVFQFIPSLKGQSIYDTLSVSEKIEGISKFWKEASYNFVFFDKVQVNWDSAYQEYLPKALQTKNVYEYHKLLNEFASLLNDGHTYIAATDYFYKDIGGFPLSMTKIGKRRFVSKIDERLFDEIPVGCEIIAINNLPVDSFMNKRRTIFKGVTYDFTFKTKDNRFISKQIIGIAGKDRVKYLPVSSMSIDFEHQTLADNLAFIKINTFSDSLIPQKFIEILPEIYKAKGLIIDIRRNSGGNDKYARQIAEYLVSNNYTVGSAWKSRLNDSAKKAIGSFPTNTNIDETNLNRKYFEGDVFEYHQGDTVFISPQIKKVNIPIVILIGKNTFSAAEDFLIYLDKSKNVTLIGQNTYGSSGQPLKVKLPKGLYGFICSKRDTYPDGRDFIGIGIKPDVLIEQNVEDYFNQKDTELQSAINFLKNRK